LIDGGTVRLPRLVGLSRALDMILTGRAVEAEEALQMGLANRVVEPGTCRVEAEALAEQIAHFPQQCMRTDRRSAYQQWNLPLKEAMANEFRLGLRTIQSGETAGNVRRFVEGEGRHGKFT
jgi:enoyl-CoA hydratase